jgi:hypothetical protein
MSLRPISSDSGIQDLAKTIAERFDADRNGQLSMTEFADVMKALLAGPAKQTFPSASINTPVVKPATVAADRAKVGTMAGFDPLKLANLDHTTIKYQVGRVLQYFPNTPQGLRDALAEIQAIVPGATITGTNGDKLDFGSYSDPKSGERIGVIDVLQAAGAGGRAWQWSPVE